MKESEEFVKDCLTSLLAKKKATASAA